MENKTTYIIIGIIAVIIFVAIVAVILSSDEGKKEEEKNVTTNTDTQAENQKDEEDGEDNFDYETAAEAQMAQPKSGETIAIMHVKNYGDITFKFFDDKAPKAVENFVTHAKEGYYNGVTFHRIIKEFMIQGGDPEGTGYGGESIWGEGFGTEIDQSLVPYRGALCMAMSSKPNSIGSQFFIEQANPDLQQAEQMRLAGYPESLVKSYEKYGGTLSLYQNYTVFGQVVDGMDTVDKIAAVETTLGSDGAMSVPTEKIIIESIDVTTQP